MKNYELLYTLPGTMTEADVRPVAETVAKTITELGGESVESQDLGKSRLAYPVKQIRYGYFQLCRFQAEPETMAEVSKKLRLMPEMLRTTIQAVAHGQLLKVDRINAVSDVFSRGEAPKEVAEANSFRKTAPAEPKTPAEKNASAIESAEEELRQVTATDTAKIEKPSTEKKTETKAEDVKLDEIDKKLDELLETDIAGV